jgi:hypothetical protein
MVIHAYVVVFYSSDIILNLLKVAILLCDPCKKTPMDIRGREIVTVASDFELICGIFRTL